MLCFLWIFAAAVLRELTLKPTDSPLLLRMLVLERAIISRMASQDSQVQKNHESVPGKYFVAEPSAAQWTRYPVVAARYRC